MKELLLFHVGAPQYGIALPLVKGIQSAKPIVVDRTKSQSPFIRKVDGEETALYDLLSIFDKETPQRNFVNEKLIIVKAEHRSVGLIVCSVDKVISAEGIRIGRAYCSSLNRS